MKKAQILSLIVGLAAAPLAQATTVGFGAFSQRTVLDEFGALLGVSSSVWAGTFSSPESVVFNSSQSISLNVANIQAAGGWEQFTLDTVSSTTNASVSGALVINGTGKVSGQVTDDTSGATKANFFNGKIFYVWIFNTNSIFTATSMGIFTSPDAAAAWAFPSNGGGFGDNATLSTAPGTAPTITALGGVGIGANSSQSQIQLVAAPEPSTALLSALGLVVMASRRRRSLKRCEARESLTE